MRIMTVVAALAGAIAICPGAEAQTDSLACTPRALDWSPIRDSGDLDRMRTFRTTVPNICPLLASEVDQAISSVEAKKAAQERARVQADANARARAQQELDAIRAELENQRRANELLATQQRQMLQQQQAELLRLQQERDQAMVAAQQAANLRAAQEQAAREAEYQRQQQLAAQQEAARQSEYQRQQQLAAQQEAERQSQQQAAAANASTDWILGRWRHGSTRYAGIDITGEMEFRRASNGAIEVTVTTRQTKDPGEYVVYRGDVTINGPTVAIKPDKVLSKTWTMWEPDRF
jgi:hypothetical protein